MKKTSLLAIGLIAISIGTLNAQTNQGKFLIGANSDLMSLAYTHYKTKSDAVEYESKSHNYVGINLNPKAGYFLIDNLAIGLDLSLGFTIFNLGDNPSSHTTLTAGPFVRYYIHTSKVLPFFELDASFGGMSDKTRIMSLGGEVGLAVPIGERVTIDMGAGYESITYNLNNEDNERQIFGALGLRVGFMVFLGSN